MNHYQVFHSYSGRMVLWANAEDISIVKNIIAQKRFDIIKDINNLYYQQKLSNKKRINEILDINEEYNINNYKIILKQENCKDLQGKNYDRYHQWV
jgi:hypothetical protein